MSSSNSLFQNSSSTNDSSKLDEQSQQLRLRVNQKLIETGEKESLKELLRSRLIESGWKDKVKNHTKDLIQHKFSSSGQNNPISVEELVAEVTPFGRSAVPDNIRNELLQRIEKFINENFEQ